MKIIKSILFIALSGCVSSPTVEMTFSEVEEIAMRRDASLSEMVKALNFLEDQQVAPSGERVMLGGGARQLPYMIYAKIQRKGLYPGLNEKGYYISETPTQISLDEDEVIWLLKGVE